MVNQKSVQPKKVVYVVESLAGGVINSMREASSCLVESGADVFLIHSIRKDTPDNYSEFFDPRVNLIHLQMSISNLLNVLKGIRDLRKILIEISPDVVHLQSSIAGALGRLAKLTHHSDARFFYSPRGFAFLSGGRARKSFFYILESFLSLISCSIVACSKSEFDLAKKLNDSVFLVENCRAFDYRVGERQARSKLIVGTAGRVAQQKNPALFAAIADRFSGSDLVEFKWIGAGDSKFELILNDSDVVITGWLDGDSVIKEIGELDIYIQTASYEGMPLAVIEAQLLGIPCVVMNVVGSRDVVSHGVTGFVADDIDSVVGFIDQLVSDKVLRETIGNNAKNFSEYRFSRERLARDLMSLYAL